MRFVQVLTFLFVLIQSVYGYTYPSSTSTMKMDGIFRSDILSIPVSAYTPIDTSMYNKPVVITPHPTFSASVWQPLYYAPTVKAPGFWDAITGQYGNQDLKYRASFAPVY